MKAIALALLMLAPADVYVRQYAPKASSNNGYLDAVVDNPGGADGVHMLSHCVASSVGDECPHLPADRAAAKRARDKGLRVVWGFRVGRNYEDPGQWANAAELVRYGAGFGTERLVVLDLENYWGGGECHLEPARAETMVAPLVEALHETGNRVAWYPANPADTCGGALTDAVGGELWVEYTFADVGRWHDNRTRWRADMADNALRDWALRERFPGVPIRPGYYDEALRDVYDNAPRSPSFWVFDKVRQGAERLEWGTPAWESAQSLSSLNNPSHVFTFHALRGSGLPRWGPDEPPSSGIRWDRAIVGGSKGAAPPPHDEGITFDRHWHYELTDIPNADARTVSFEVRLPADVSERFPVAGSWADHGCCRAWLVYVDSGLLKVAIGQGTRGGGHTWRTHETRTLGAAIGGERVRVVLGWDARTVRTAATEWTLDKDTNNQRARVHLAYAPAASVFGEEHSHAPGLVHVGQFLVWDRLLSRDEMAAAMAGQYPWGL